MVGHFKNSNFSLFLIFELLNLAISNVQTCRCDTSFLRQGLSPRQVSSRPPISLRSKTPKELQGLPTSRLRLGLAGEGNDTRDCLEKKDLVSKAMALTTSSNFVCMYVCPLFLAYLLLLSRRDGRGGGQ